MKLHHHFRHGHFKRGVLLFFISSFCLSMSVIQFAEYKALNAQSAVAPEGYEWKLIFGDEFNDTVVDPTKWGKCYFWYSKYYDGCFNSGSGEVQYYQTTQVSEAGGSLRLTAEKENVQGWNGTAEQTFNYTSGMVTTVRYNYESFSHVPFATTYGFFEARMKLPAGQGLWPAFWLLEEDQTAPPEIDIMEFLGHDIDTVHMNYHYLDNGHKQAETSFSGPNFTSGWHTYAVNWEPGKITWYIDGVARKTFNGSSVTDKPMYLLLNLAVGGNWPGSPDATTSFPSTVEIDYVRVYQTQKIQSLPATNSNGTNTSPTSTSTIPANSTAPPTASTSNEPTVSSVPVAQSQPPSNQPKEAKTISTTNKEPSPLISDSKPERKQRNAIIGAVIWLLSLIGAASYFYFHHRNLSNP